MNVLAGLCQALGSHPSEIHNQDHSSPGKNIFWFSISSWQSPVRLVVQA